MTENSNGYQVAYIRLLSKFVDTKSIANAIDFQETSEASFELFPNPSTGSFWIRNAKVNHGQVTVTNMQGTVVKTQLMEKGQQEINLSEVPSGTYFVKLSYDDTVIVKPFVKL